MTNTQLLLTIGRPSVVVVVDWFQTNSRPGRVEAGLDKVDFLRVDKYRDMVAPRDSIHRDMIAAARTGCSG